MRKCVFGQRSYGFGCFTSGKGNAIYAKTSKTSGRNRSLDANHFLNDLGIDCDLQKGGRIGPGVLKSDTEKEPEKEEMTLLGLRGGKITYVGKRG